MAVIPPDAGIRMRLQNDAGPLLPTPPVQEIPTDLPELRTGQTFTATIQEALPENTYKALVAGKQITLQLPEGTKSGDTLELVVVDRTPRVVIAQLTAATAAAAANEPYQYAKLSAAGQMISDLLLPQGETPEPAVLNRGEPLLRAAPLQAAELVPVLQKAISQSGLFYESHQSQWVAGKLPVEQLLQEPQGQRSAPAALAQHGLTPAAHEAGRMPSQAEAAQPFAPRGESAVRREDQLGNPSAQTTTLAQSVPQDLRPIVQQQLDATATQRLIWHGEAWPNQAIEWEIMREDEKPAAAVPDDEVSWRTTLRLDTPRLGHIDAALRLNGATIAMTLTTPAGTTAAAMQKALPALAASLAAAGISLLSAHVSHGHE